MIHPWFMHTATPWTDVLRGLNLIASVVVVFALIRVAFAGQVYRPYRAVLLAMFFMGLAGLASPLRLGASPSLGFYPFSLALYCSVYGVWHIRIDRAHGVRATPETTPDKREHRT